MIATELRYFDDRLLKLNEKGWLPNPVTVRLVNATIDHVDGLACGPSIDVFARRIRFQRGRFMNQLEAREVQCHLNVQKLLPSVVLASGCYANRLSLALVVMEAGVVEAALVREFQAARITIEPRRS